MKKFFISLVLLSLFLFTGVCQASWTITSVTSFDQATVWDATRSQWQTVYRIKLICTGDGNAASEFNLSDVISANMLGKIKGGAFAQWMTEAGTVPATVDAVTISFDGDKGQDLVSGTTTTLTSKPEEFKTSWIFWDLQITIGDIGDATEQINLYLTFVK